MNPTTFDRNRRVREIAIDHPASTRVFESFGIDYCCTGRRPLQEACKSANAPLDKVVQALDELLASNAPAEEQSWTTSSLAELTAHIAGRHHRYIRDETPRIERLLQTVLGRHGKAHPELSEIQETFAALSSELFAHMWKEEQVLFQLLDGMENAARFEAGARSGYFGSVELPISRMLADHDDAGALTAKIRDLSAGYRAPEGSCPIYRGLYQALQDFERDLHQHVHLENNILFPRALEMEQSRRETAHVSG
jgi:regulator of cell morphogenesis and NO signaling